MHSGAEISITAQGCENGLRGEKDGSAYLGCKKRAWKSGIRVRQSEILNDVVIKLKEKEMAQSYRGRHTQIWYCLVSQCYKIKDLGIGFGSYLKLDKPLIIKENYLIMLGESFMTFNMIQDTSLGKQECKEGGLDQKLRVTIFAGPANGEIL